MPKIRLLSWNVNGIRAVDRKNALDWFFEEKPDIFCLQETKAHPDQLPDRLTQMDGYHIFFSSAEKKGYSGVALYTKIKPLKVKYGFGLEKFDNEGRVIIAEYDHFVLINVYFPNGKQSKERLQYKMDFYDAYLDYADSLKADGKKIVMCGDVNTAHKEIDLAHPKANEKSSGFLPIERAWIDKMITSGYLDTFRMFNDQPEQYTWWDVRTRARERNIGWRIDYFFISVNLKNNIENAFILPEIMGSDHCPIGIELNI
ncbi:exodeoxyribonuclease III [candidate division KSB1 bacterium]|nr:exodeoxyribonuclease III [candidate division KSB1 bacterium]